jgi:hypothetical protein
LTAGLAGITPLNASVSISPSSGISTSIPVANSFVTAGYIQAGLSTAVRNTGNTGNLGTGGASFNQCNSQNTAGAFVLQFTENFGTAFKTRVQPTATYNGQAGASATLQNTPGNIYNSESGLILPATSITGATTFRPGLADFGTRLKAVFNNIPSGVRIFVSTTNLAANLSSNTTVAPTPNTNTSAYAVLISSETAVDGDGTVPTLASTGTVGSGATIFEVPISGNSATAIWEVLNTNPAQNESFNFGVWISYTANPGANSPTPDTTATVNMSYAPTSTATSASATAPIPRFADTSAARNVLVVRICQTYLLFPYLANPAGQGFDTGIAIANTSTDPSTIGTGAQNGTCDMFFYGDSAPATLPVTSPNIASGKVYTTLVSTAAPGFTGYMIARCNFQWAHGFAFISDIGARNLAMGYLALVVNNGTLSRGTPAETLGN